MSEILIGRSTELALMQQLLQSQRPEMLALVGRRRVGKTFLVRKAYEKEIVFELTGVQNGNKSEQFQNFMLNMKGYFPNYHPVTAPKDWITAFHTLGEQLDQLQLPYKPVVFMDELPWLAAPRTGFLNGLSYFWNSWASKRNVLIVICGSAASWMIQKVINNKGGLHNRVTQLIQLQPFTLLETEQFCLSRGIHLSRSHILQLYMVMGGIPAYLAMLQPGQSAIQQIQRLFFESSGLLRTEFDRLYASLFQNAQSHIEIIKALATKWRGLTRQEIVQLTSFTNGGMLSECLAELQQSGFIEVYSSYDKVNRDTLYRLIDCYSLFYLTLLTNRGKAAKTTYQKLTDIPGWQNWSGYAFENTCLLHIRQLKSALGIEGISTTVATFLAKGDAEHTGAQIDLLIDRADQSISLIEMKFLETELKPSKELTASVAQKKATFMLKTRTKKHVFVHCVAPMGLSKELKDTFLFDSVIVLEQLFS
jgi:uncharacterized protein